jgi:hypothetical protein
MSQHQDEVESGVSALTAFASQFGSNNQFSQLIMEIVLEELMQQQPNYNKETNLEK